MTTSGGDIYGSPSPKMVAISEIKTMSPDAPTVSASTEQNATPSRERPLGRLCTGYDDPCLCACRLRLRHGDPDGLRQLAERESWIWVASSSASRTVSAVLSGGGTVICFVDGVRLGIPRRRVDRHFWHPDAGAGVHGVILTAASGQITVTSVQVS